MKGMNTMADNEGKNNTGNEKVFDPSRRRFIKNTGLAAGGLIGGSILGGVWNNPFKTEETGGTGEEKSKELLQEARTFFSRSDDFETLAAATERIFPKDDNGPGAIELGVPYFIDKQLAGFWGFNSKDYTQGPFKPDKSDTHGLQSKLNRGEMFLEGLRRIQEISQKEHDEKFFDLEGEDQDAILERFESNDVDVKGMRADTFFALLRNTTIEGVYSDPVYGGNKDMQGWKMMEYPGPRMGWMDEIESEDFQSLEPEGLRTYQGGNV